MSALWEPIGRPCTAEDLERLSQQGYRYELWRGDLREMAPAGEFHGRSTNRLTAYAAMYVLEHDLGEGYAAETGFWLEKDPDSVLAPDWAFVARARLPEPLARGYAVVVPDLVLETRSPNDTRRDIADKIEQWLQKGVRIVWDLDPEGRSLTVHRKDRASQRLGIEDTLSGEEVLPGFSLPLRRLFPSAGGSPAS